MSKLSDLTTLRCTNFNLSSHDNKITLKNLLLFYSIEYCLFKKDVSVSRFQLIENNNKLYLNLELFYRTRKVVKYDFYFKNLRADNNVKLIPLLPLNNKVIYISIKNLNSFLTRKFILKTYKVVLKISSSLFSRRFTLFVDFVKLTSLFVENRISVKLYLMYIGYIFKFIQKRRHGKFIFFIKNLLSYLTTYPNIKGLRFEISGRISGKPRSRVMCINKGNLQLQSLSNSIEYSKAHVYTVYGAFGIKLWINKHEFIST